MRILHLIDTGGPGGAETVFVDLLRGLQSAGFEGFPVVPRVGWLHDTLIESGLEPVVVPSRGRVNVRYLARLVGLMRRLDVHLVQTHLFGAGLYGAMAAKIARVPAVCTFHGMPDLTSAERGASMRYRLLRLTADRVVCVSRGLSQEFERRSGFPSERLLTIHNGIDLAVYHSGRDSQLRRTLGVGDSDVLVGTVANFRPAKALDVFVRAAALMDIPERRVKFVIAGQRSQPILSQLEELRRHLGLEDRLEFLGFRSDVERVIRSLDIYVCSSSSEGFSLTTVQAMASGVPVVATRSGGPEEIIRDGVDGRLVDVGAPEQIAAAVEGIFSDRSAAESMVARARDRVRERFSVAAMLRRYVDTYRELSE